MFQRMLNRAGRWIDELLFGGEHEREFECIVAMGLVAIFAYVIWEAIR